VAGRVGLDDELDQVSQISSRLGSLTVEDKEYFSGSIVEAGRRAVTEPVLNKSNSYNEERYYISSWVLFLFLQVLLLIWLQRNSGGKDRIFC
jgi:Protein SOSEKI 2, plant